MTTITIDPITRIEGHLKVSVSLDADNIVTASQSTGNMYRGFENLLKTRQPRDAAILTQRICGVCPVPHAIASVKATEKAAGFTPSLKAILLRNLVLGANFISSNILHFYHLTLMDYISGPDLNPWKENFYQDYRFSSANNQSLLNNYAVALVVRRKAQEMQTIFGGAYPFVNNVLPGGVHAKPTSAEITNFRNYLTEIEAFVNNVYQNDINLLASTYNDYYSIGRGYGNLLSYGVFDTDTSGGLLYPAGTILNGSTSVDAFKHANIKECTTYSWYSSPSGKSPVTGTTTPSYGKLRAYSWLKAPRYNNTAYETGALARLWISGDYRRGISVMDRHIARYLETVKIIDNMKTWLNSITIEASAFTSISFTSGSGEGLTEAPRGALGHWITVSDSIISNYQIITPTCWNSSPKDDCGNLGPIEKALIGVQVTNTAEPIELLRIIHSFDPCTACSVHVLDLENEEISKFVVDVV